MAPGQARHVDLSLPPPPDAGITAIDSGIALIGVPVYAGRVPLTAVERLKKIKARENPPLSSSYTATGPSRTRCWS